MSEPRFDVYDVFAADKYLYFYGPLLKEEHTTREVQTIARLLSQLSWDEFSMWFAAMAE
jgi:hypothetical protein